LFLFACFRLFVLGILLENVISHFFVSCAAQFCEFVS
jgi:hypothetical protein